MSDYFAHAVYGVVVEPAHAALLDTAVEQYLDGLTEDERDELDDDSPAGVVADGLINDPELSERIANIRGGYQERAGGGDFFRTNDEDDFPGRSAIGPDTWLFGFGVMDFPAAQPAPEFQRDAVWHMWVTVSG